MPLRPIFAVVLIATASPGAFADTIDDSFSGTDNTSWNRQSVQLGSTGSFTIANPTVTAVRPWMAPDPAALRAMNIWDGSSLFSTGASNLQVTFANGATLTAADLDLVVNNTTLTQFSGMSATVVAVTPAVPEPGTWALALAGLGLVGAAARARRNA